MWKMLPAPSVKNSSSLPSAFCAAATWVALCGSRAQSDQLVPTCHCHLLYTRLFVPTTNTSSRPSLFRLDATLFTPAGWYSGPAKPPPTLVSQKWYMALFWPTTKISARPSALVVADTSHAQAEICSQRGPYTAPSPQEFGETCCIR